MCGDSPPRMHSQKPTGSTPHFRLPVSWWPHGIAILVKDEIDTAGMPTTLGTLVFRDYRPPKDAFVIDKLRKAGAIILGKTTLSEFAAGDTYGSIFGVTRNPYDFEPERVIESLIIGGVEFDLIHVHPYQWTFLV